MLPVQPDTILSLSPMDRIDVIQGLGGTVMVRVTIAPNSSDDLWETITHHIGFKARWECEALARKIKEVGKVNLNNWRWVPSKASPFPWMHCQPIAQGMVREFRAKPQQPWED